MENWLGTVPLFAPQAAERSVSENLVYYRTVGPGTP